MHRHVPPWLSDYPSAGKSEHLSTTKTALHDRAGLAAYWLMERLGDFISLSVP